MMVVDASVVIKLFKIEEDSATARAFVDHSVESGLELVMPTIALYEALSAALHIGYSMIATQTLFARLEKVGLSVETPSQADIELAERICTSPAPGGGYPAMFDSIYHAMAIVRGGLFMTADAKHASRAAEFGSIRLLSEWAPG